jgi:hypothetical protein
MVDIFRKLFGAGKKAGGTLTEILIELSERPETGYGKISRFDMSEEQRVFADVWSAEGSISMDGFALYFQNGGDEHTNHAADSLTAIGAIDAANVVRKAIEIAFPDGLPVSEKSVAAVAAKFPEPLLQVLHSLSEQFFDCRYDVAVNLHAFASRHPEVFGQVDQPVLD